MPVIRLPIRPVDPKSPQALIELARRRAAWLRANPNATADQLLAAGAEIARQLGL